MGIIGSMVMHVVMVMQGREHLRSVGKGIILSKVGEVKAGAVETLG